MKKTSLIFLIFFIPLVLQAEKKRYISFEVNGLYGFKDKSGKVIIKPEYDFVNDFTNESIAFVVLRGKWTCIDTQNKILLQTFVFDNGPDYYSEGLARFTENNKIGYFDNKCKKVIAADFDFAFPFEKEYAQVCNDCKSIPDGEHKKIIGGKVGLINKKGNIVVPIEYDSILISDPKRKIVTVRKGKESLDLPLK